MTEIRATSTVHTEAFGTSTVTITLTQEEAALVHHVRGNCHNSTQCALCKVERDLYNTRREAERDRERAVGHALELLGQARRAERQLNSIISG